VHSGKAREAGRRRLSRSAQMAAQGRIIWIDRLLAGEEEDGRII